MKRFLINTYTDWCGEELEFSAIAESDSDPELCAKAQEAAYSSFIDFGGLENILESMFPYDEDYTDEQLEEASKKEDEYYGYIIEEWDETRNEEEWDWYELIYDANEKV